MATSVTFFRQTDAEIDDMIAEPERTWPSQQSPRVWQLPWGDETEDGEAIVDDHFEFVGGLKEDDWTGLERTYHCLHFLLTGTAWGGKPPLNFILTGGEPIGGDGPRAFRSADVQVIAAALKRITPERLRRHYDVEPMRRLKIYKPECPMDGENGLEGDFAWLRHFVTETAAAGLGLVVRLE